MNNIPKRQQCHTLESRAAVLFIECQNEWLSAYGNLRRKLVEDDAGFQSAINSAKKLLQIARKNKAFIVHVTLQPDKNYRILGHARYGLRAAIPNAQTWQEGMQDIPPDFMPQVNEILVSERTGASAFAGSMLDSVLRNNHIDTLYISGFATHVCVESTLREAHDKGYTCHVVTDATAAFNCKQQMYFEMNILPHFGNGLTVLELE